MLIVSKKHGVQSMLIVKKTHTKTWFISMLIVKKTKQKNINANSKKKQKNKNMVYSQC